VEDGRIVSVESTTAERSSSHVVIQGRGRTLLPGFIDLHTHISTTSAPYWYATLPDVDHNLEAYLYAGVTRVLDLGGAPAQLQEQSARARSGAMPSPHIYYAGRTGGAPGGYPSTMASIFLPWPLDHLLRTQLAAALHDRADARAFVQDNVEHGAHVIKIVRDEAPRGAPVLSDELLRDVVEAAHASDRLVFVHVGTAEDALAAAAAGADVLAHLPYRGPISEEQAALICEGGRGVIPTLGAWERPAAVERGEKKVSALMRKIESEEVLLALGEMTEHTGDLGPEIQTWGEAATTDRNRPENLRRVLAAGCRLLIGSDSSVPGTTPGASLHEELVLLQEVGIEPAVLLQAVTADAAAVLGEDDDVGRIAPGFVADLLLVEGRPDEDVRHTANIAEVILGGRLVHRMEP